MDFQEAYNLAIGVGAVALGWIMKTLWDSVKRLQDDDSKLADRINAIEVLVAGKYVTHTDMENLWRRLDARFDKLERKLDGKVDK